VFELVEVDGTAVNVPGFNLEVVDALTCTDITTPVPNPGPLDCKLGFFYIMFPYVATYVNKKFTFTLYE